VINGLAKTVTDGQGKILNKGQSIMLSEKQSIILENSGKEPLIIISVKLDLFLH
jgi:hypothetical protein